MLRYLYQSTLQDIDFCSSFLRMPQNTVASIVHLYDDTASNFFFYQFDIMNRVIIYQAIMPENDLYPLTSMSLCNLNLNCFIHSALKSFT